MPILLAVLVVMILMSDSYLRYLAFRAEMTTDERKILWRRFFLYAVFNVALFAEIFDRFGIVAPVYKAALILGWSPWLAIFMLTVRRGFSQHIFVLGMQEIWSLIQHNWAAIFVVIALADGTAQEVIMTHAILYLLLFVAFLPVERRCFVKLLPPRKFFDDYGKITAFFPIIMSLGVIILWAQEPMIHSWQERFSRFFLPFAFFFFYRHTMITSEQLRNRKRTAQHLRRMHERLDTLSEYTRLMQESREQLAVMRHDLRHSYRLIYMMLREGKVDVAKEYIESREKLIGTTAVKNFCRLPLINAALSIYIHRAEKTGIKVRHKVNLPQTLSVDESECALLISNLLENAINASNNQPPNRREISVVMQHVSGQFVLEVANRYDAPITFDEKNYPQAAREGHGFGMASVKNFSDKYNAYTDFSQENGIFKVTMYWVS